MSSQPDASSQEFFERMYQRDADPWNFARDAYEQSRYDAIVDALAGRRFKRAFEAGCSVGVLTERLAPFCEELVAIDLSETAVARARARCSDYAQVRIEQGSVANTDPGPIDLLVLSEIGYYFTVFELRDWSDRLVARLLPGGVLVASHWLGASPDHVLAGNLVQDIIQDLARENHFILEGTQRTDNFRLDLWKTGDTLHA